MKANRYCVAVAVSPVELCEQVEALLPDWTVQGGVALAVSPLGELLYAQALVREDAEIEVGVAWRAVELSQDVCDEPRRSVL
ncbi:MAG: hypothetical protein IPO08_23865 [Xanthomonadales bacterium]|nr:hypothetical protein [Xanthomonadales bacterium]